MLSLSQWYSTIRRWWNYFAPSPKKFNVEALEYREKFKPDYRKVASSLSSHLDFQTVLDVGCAQGFLMEPLHDEGFSVQGIEASEDVVEFLPDALVPRVTIGDFCEVTGHYDLVCCVEVAEHIEPARSEELVEKLCALSNKWIYFTAAPPGQDGHGHINCRPHRHWIQWFEKHEWYVREELTEKFRRDLDAVERTHWLRDNSFIISSQKRT